MDGIHALFDFWGLGENYLEKLQPAADWTGAYVINALQLYVAPAIVRRFICIFLFYVQNDS